jgi:predicted dehydrogenase/nucleoside-diphosphate-sugar epimerase
MARGSKAKVMTAYRTALVGAGFISSSHIEALRSGVPNAKITAIVDRNLALAESQARQWNIPQAFSSVDALIDAKVADVAHVAVPPDAHAPVARQLLGGGLNVFLEKPMATSSADADGLTALAERQGLVLGINQNFVFHPTYQKAKRILAQGRLGPIRAMHTIVNVPLRQLSARQFGHWMFAQPLNILLEQAVHPLSQQVDLLGVPDAVAGQPLTFCLLGPGRRFYDRWRADFSYPDKLAHLHISFGQKFLAWRFIAICDDGLLECDLAAERVTVQKRTQWPDFLDKFIGGVGAGSSLVRQSTASTAAFAASLFKMAKRPEGFTASMRGSVAAFYEGLPNRRAPIDGAFGASLLRICETIARSAEPDAKPEMRPLAVASPVRPDTVVFGGSGFIGSHLVARLIEKGHTVRVVARSVDRTQPPFNSPKVEVMRGDVTNRSDIERAVAGVPRVVNLAHGGGGASWSEIERTMVGSGRAVVECAAAAGAERVVHVGSIAGLYLGDASETIVGATPPDPKASERSLYARAKAETDRVVQDVAAARGIGLVILRPGVVVGAGTAAIHSGLGFFNNDQHVIGWNAGKNPLPFVLVEDVADAIVGALESDAALGKSFNLVGDVRPSAREFVALLAEATNRPLMFHPQAVDWLYSSELFKWLIKRGTGKKADVPSRRDLLSRGLSATFDCSDAKEALGWKPNAEREIFIAKAIDVHRAPLEHGSLLAQAPQSAARYPAEGRVGV